jgi:glycosyltransferase involved in cell wall biosynthesis
MSEPICAIAESLIKPREDAPLLTVFIPTHNRVPELIQAVESVASQLNGGLERKVEVLVSDNASGPEGRAAIRDLAARFEGVNYMINAVDQGGHFQAYTAPWRSRGVWNWVFGSDDALVPGAVGKVVDRLEADDPGFLTMDKSVWNRAMDRELYAAANAIPDRAFAGFADLFKGVGLHQVAFLGASLEKSEAGRNIEPLKYMSADTYHNYTIAYFEKHQHSKCVYMADSLIRRRLDNSVLSDYLGIVFEDVGMKFPMIMMNLARPFGVDDSIFEQINGSRLISSYDPPAITMVDNVFEYMLRGIAKGRAINYFQRAAFEAMCASWRPHRREQFDQIWAINETMRKATEAMNESRSQYERQVVEITAERERLNQMALTYTDKAALKR